jgi:hypothetical protein
VDCISYDQIRRGRGSLPLLIYSREIGLQGKYPIWYYTISNTSYSLAVHADSVVNHTPWSCGLGHLWWCGPCLVLWVLGVITPQLVPERLVSSKNTILSLFELTNELLITRSRLSTSLTSSRAAEEDVWAVGHASELFEWACELLERVSKLFNSELSLDLREVKVCQKDVRGSRFWRYLVAGSEKEC